MADDIRADLTAESRRTIEKLKATDAMPALRKQMRAAGAPLVGMVRQAVRDLPSTRSRYKTPGGSLRNAVASGVQQKMKISARAVLLLIKQVPKGGKSNLGNLLEGKITPWEHPTYGHDPQVTQQAEPFFYETLDKAQPEVYERIKVVLDDVERKLI